MQTRGRCACRVCGAHEIEVDEVLEGGVLRLAACERCGHRWTERPLCAVARPLERAAWEVAGAA
jgi:hypothetical protein